MNKNFKKVKYLKFDFLLKIEITLIGEFFYKSIIIYTISNEENFQTFFAISHSSLILYLMFRLRTNLLMNYNKKNI